MSDLAFLEHFSAFERHLLHILATEISLATEAQIEDYRKLTRHFGLFGTPGPGALSWLIHNGMISVNTINGLWEPRGEPLFTSQQVATYPNFDYFAHRVQWKARSFKKKILLVFRPTEELLKIYKDSREICDLTNQEQVFHSLVMTDIHQKYIHIGSEDTENVGYFPKFAFPKDTPIGDPENRADAAIFEWESETSPWRCPKVMIVANGQSIEELRALHHFYTDKKIEYELW